MVLNEDKGMVFIDPVPGIRIPLVISDCRHACICIRIIYRVIEQVDRDAGRVGDGLDRIPRDPLLLSVNASREKRETQQQSSNNE